MPVDRDVALTAGADHGRDQRDLRRVGDVVEINAAVVADEERGAGEGEVGVGAAVVGASSTLRPTRRRSTRGWWRRGGSRIEGGDRGEIWSEAGGFWQRNKPLQTKRRFTRVVQACLQSNTRIIGARARIGIDRCIILPGAKSGKRDGQRNCDGQGTA